MYILNSLKKRGKFFQPKIGYNLIDLSKMPKVMKEEVGDVKNIFYRIKRRDFSGNEGQVVKNSLYQFFTGSVYKIGSFFFTIILARLLMPELFGLYNLALATIILFSNFTNIGTGKAILKYVSNSLGKRRNREAKAYIVHILKIQVIFSFGAIFVLIIMSKFLANTYYGKPIFLALLGGVFYILFSSLLAILETILQASNNFKAGLFREVFFEILRLFFIPIITLIVLKNYASKEFILFSLILATSLLYLASFIFLLIFAKKDLAFLKLKKCSLTKKQKKDLNYFLVAVSTTIFSGIFLGYIDLLMLGHFVSSEFIGYYGAAFSLIGTFTVLIPFSLVLFPIFSRLEGERLEKGFRKSIKITFLISSVFLLFSLLISSFIIQITYGQEYSLSLNVFRILSLLIITFPLTSIYENYFISQGKQKMVAYLLIGTTILNLGLNYFLITWLLSRSELAAIIGASIAVVVTRFIYLFLLVFMKRQTKKI